MSETPLSLKRGMATAISTTCLAPGHRAEAIRTLVWESVIQIEIDHHVPPESLSVDLRLGNLGPLGVCAVRATSTTVRRTQRLASRDRAYGHVTEINAGHLSLISCPDAVTNLIVTAAQTTS